MGAAVATVRTAVLHPRPPEGAPSDARRWRETPECVWRTVDLPSQRKSPQLRAAPLVAVVPSVGRRCGADTRTTPPSLLGGTLAPVSPGSKQRLTSHFSSVTFRVASVSRPRPPDRGHHLVIRIRSSLRPLHGRPAGRETECYGSAQSDLAVRVPEEVGRRTPSYGRITRSAKPLTRAGYLR